jgi:hypothetical protein
MNRELLTRNVGQLLLLQPCAQRLDENGNPLPELRDAWRLDSVSRDAARLTNQRTSHFVDIGLDSIYSYASDPNAKNLGEHHSGILQLKVQVYMDGLRTWVQATVRPGEPLPPPHQQAAPAQEATRPEISAERFAIAGRTYYGNLWAKRNADLWSSISSQVQDFDRAEWDQLGSAGYMARLCRLLQIEINVATNGLIGAVLDVHRDFGLPMEQGVEQLLLQWSRESLRAFCQGLPGFIERHIGRKGVNRNYNVNVFAHQAALSEAHLANTIRDYFWNARNVPSKLPPGR